MLARVATANAALTVASDPVLAAVEAAEIELQIQDAASILSDQAVRSGSKDVQRLAREVEGATTVAAYEAARIALQTVPTTMAGVKALLAFMTGETVADRDDLRTGLASLSTALCALA